MVFPGAVLHDVYVVFLPRVTQDELIRIARFDLEIDLCAYVSSNAEWVDQLAQFLTWCNSHDKLRLLVHAVSKEYPDAEEIDSLLRTLRDREQAAIRNIGQPKGVDPASFRSEDTRSPRVSEDLAYKEFAGAAARVGTFTAPMDSTAKVLDAANANRSKGSPAPRRAKRTLTVMEVHVSQLKLVLACLNGMENLKEVYQTYLFGERLKRLRGRIADLVLPADESDLCLIVQDIEGAIGDLRKPASVNRLAVKHLAEYQPRQKLDPKLEDAVSRMSAIGTDIDGTVQGLDELSKVCQSPSMDCLPILSNKLEGIEKEISRLLSDLADANTTCFAAFGTCLELLNGDLQRLKGET